MKIIYNIAHIANRGGKERVLVNKANYMAEVWGFEIIIVTTDQKGEPMAYSLSDKVRHIDLGICYEDYRRKGVIQNRMSQAKCIRQHKKGLKGVLYKERPDIVVSMFGREMTWLPGILDGSRKVLEYHFYKDVLKSDARKQPLLWWKYWVKIRSVRKYDKFIVLTEEDKKLWGSRQNMAIIPNSLTFYPENRALLQNKRILMVGRLSPEKGFDRMINIWREMAKCFPAWKLSIIGDGNEKDRLLQQIERLGLEHSVEVLPSTPDIILEYLKSSVFVLTSRYEGFSMVLVEAMACGVPVVAYACKCGPKEIIHDGEDGFLVEEGNADKFIEKLSLLLKNTELRTSFGKKARQNITRFSQDRVMQQWKKLFEDIIS